MEVDFTPLHPGTIASIPSEGRSIGPAKAAYDPLGLPLIEGQCAHVEVDLAGCVLGRCLDDADRHGINGWLCYDHAKLLYRFRPTITRAARLGLDAEVIDGIIKTDARAIARGTRVPMRFGRVKITYLEPSLEEQS